jgi:hypothetical protein
MAAAVLLALSGAAPALAATAGPPTAVLVGARDGMASVSFTPPSSNGGSPITQYVVMASPGGITASGTSSPVAISGLTDGVSYTFTVTAVNSSGPGTPSSPSASATPLAPPAASVDPAILGSPEVGQTLFATSGTWTEMPQLSYQWLDCSQSSGDCFGVAGATSGSSYTVSPLDGGYTIEVVVTAVNTDDEFASDTSDATATVVAGPGAPGLQTVPTLSAVDASEPVSASTGTWNGAPTGYSYQWWACSPGLGLCHPVTGLSSGFISFTPAGDENGDYLEAAVVATNAFGSSVPAYSAPSGTISLPSPTISIAWPSNGSVYSPSLSPAASDALYTCSASGGATIVSCVGTVAAGSQIPFSPGSHSFTVTATDSAGEITTSTVNYAVGGNPAITLTGPGNGATYTQGISLPVTATCTAFDGSPLHCTMAQAPQPACQALVVFVGCDNASQFSGVPVLDTHDLGQHTLTVNATDAFGESANLTISYTVVAGPSVTAGPDARLTFSRLSQSSSRWQIGGGTHFSLTPNVAAVVTFVFQRDLKGRKAAGHCVAQTTANAHEPACTRSQRVGSLRRYEPGGVDVVPFNGRLGSSSLAPGSYTVLVSATAIGEPSPVVVTAGTLKFTIAG